MGQDTSSGLANRAVHLSVVKELLGNEIRDIIRAELAAAATVGWGNGLARLRSSRSLLEECVAGDAQTSAEVPAPPPAIISTSIDSVEVQEEQAAGEANASRPRLAEQLLHTGPLLEDRVVAEVQVAHSGAAAPPPVAVATCSSADGEAPPIAEFGEASVIRPLLLAHGNETNAGRHRGSVASPEHGVSHIGTNARARHSLTSDMVMTGNYLHDLAVATRLDAFESEEQDRIEADWLVLQLPSFADCIFSVDNIISKIGTMEAPEPSSTFSRVADSCWFQLLGNLATMLNCMFLTYTANWELEHYSERTPDIISCIDMAFVGFFAVELAARLGRYRLYYFVDTNFMMNWTDFIIVLGGLIDVASDVVGSSPLLRQLRALRLLKVLRVVRILRMFRTLRVILQSLASTLVELIWCAITLLLIEYMFALMLVMCTGSFLREGAEALADDQVRNLKTAFGSVPVAMLSLFTVSMGGGDWAIHYGYLSPTGLVPQAIYLVFVAFSFIAVLNVILGIFVEKAMKNLEPTKEEQAQEHAAEELQMARDLKALCEEGDKDEDGMLSPQEWHVVFSEGKIGSYMDLRGFRSHDLRAFFDLCAACSESGNVDIDLFVKGCMRLKGPSSSFDVQSMLVELHHVHQQMRTESDQRHRDIMQVHEHLRDQFARLTSAKISAT